MMTRLQTVFVGLLVLAAAPVMARGAEVYSDNVVIVLDGSGSMEEPIGAGGMTKMIAAQQALHTVLSQLPPTTQVGLLVFSRSIKQDWPYPLGPQDADQLATAIDSIRPGGGTPLGEYIKKGADRLLQQRAKQFGYGSYRLLIVTDGESQDSKLVDRYAAEVMARGITIDVIGVKMTQDHTLATKVHSYRRADDPASLTQAIADVMAEVSGTGAGDTAGEDAFEVLAPLPPEIARTMVQALAVSGNSPIGEAPSVHRRPGKRDSGSAVEIGVAAGAVGISLILEMVIGAIVVSIIGLALWRAKSRRR